MSSSLGWIDELAARSKRNADLDYVPRKAAIPDGHPPETQSATLWCPEEAGFYRHQYVGKRAVMRPKLNTRRVVTDGAASLFFQDMEVSYYELIYQCGCNNCRVFGTEQAKGDED